MKRYDGNSVPRENIAINVLAELGVPEDRCATSLNMILDSARSVGFIREIKGKEYVELTGVPLPKNRTPVLSTVTILTKGLANQVTTLTLMKRW